MEILNNVNLLINLQAMQMLINIANQNLVFFFSIRINNLSVKCCTSFLLMQKCSIQHWLLYCVIKNLKYHVVNITLT